MEHYVQPAADRIVGRVLPRLEAIPVREVVRRLPVVERLIAILYRREERGDEVRRQEAVEDLYRLDPVGARFPGRALGRSS